MPTYATSPIQTRPSDYFSLRSCFGLCCLCCGLLVLSGCSKSQPERPAVHAASGQVLFGGKPVRGAFVVFHPTSGPAEHSARAQTDKDGRFAVTTFEQGDGAIPGTYKVTVEHCPLIKEGDSYSRGPNVLPAKYARPQTSDLKVEVADGGVALPSFQLKR